MTMTWEEFLKYVSHFQSISSDIGDGWLLKQFEDITGGSYLVKQLRQAIINNKPEDTEDSVQDDISNEQFEGHDQSTVDDADKSSDMMSWEYHILYSPSYAVPVLYFNVWNSGGKLFSLEEVWKKLQVPPEAFNDKWQLVTQQEHPLLLRPFYQLHPCKTAQLLSNFKNTKVNPLVTWLSSVGPFVHLYLPLQYGRDVDS